MYSAGISPNTLAVLKKLATTSLKKHYYLAGGTACALHFGHRLSYDLDFFSQNPLNPQEIAAQLYPLGKLIIDQNDDDTMLGFLDEVKISFFIYPYPLLEVPEPYESVQIASKKDLACMKLEVVSSRGSKRDFIDLYQIAQEYPLSKQFEWFTKKYQGTNISTTHVLKSLTYFVDAEAEPMPIMNFEVDWETVKRFFQKEAVKITKSWGL